MAAGKRKPGWGMWILAALLPLATSAEEQGGPGACRTDAQKFCVAAQGNRDKMMDCLIDHQNDIADVCYTFLKTTLERQRSVRESRQGRSDTQSPEPRAAPSNPIYKIKGPDGRVVYTNTPIGDGSSAQEVKLDRVIDAVPLRPSAR